MGRHNNDQILDRHSGPTGTKKGAEEQQLLAIFPYWKLLFQETL